MKGTVRFDKALGENMKIILTVQGVCDIYLYVGSGCSDRYGTGGMLGSMVFQWVSITIYEINSRKRGSIHVQSTKYVFL